jgi:hypothetical protein
MESGLYETLISKQLLIEHKPIQADMAQPEAYCVIQPEQVPFISYPYEWSFGQLKDAALTTLQNHRTAMEYGMILKDASAYNIQFIKGKPKLMDTLSFDFYEEGVPWVAYGQFCRHFLAPLFLMAYVDIRLSQFLRIYIDGIPIDMASKLLKGKGGFAAKQHIHWHARAISRHSEDGKTKEKIRKIKISKFNYLALIDNLIRLVEGMRVKEAVTEWMDYYNNTNYSETAFKSKESIIANFIEEMNFSNIWDLGANDGTFARVALNHGVSGVVAFDIDPLAVERNYYNAKRNGENILPLVLDLTNPSPGIGFANRERVPIGMRGKPDCILALALIHHLAISNNLPFDKIAAMFSEQSDNLIIEFVPKEDSQAQVLLATRKDIFLNYNQSEFEAAFKNYYDILRTETVAESQRTIYLFRKRRLS